MTASTYALSMHGVTAGKGLRDKEDNESARKSEHRRGKEKETCSTDPLKAERKVG